MLFVFFFFSSRRRHTRCYRDWSSDVCSSDLVPQGSAIAREGWDASMKLSDVLANCGAEQVSGDKEQPEVTQVAHDSRLVDKGTLFVAVPGLKVDGSSFAAEALAKGA